MPKHSEYLRSSGLALGLGALFLALTVSIATAAPPASSGAGKFVNDLAVAVVAMFNNPQLSLDEKENRMRAIAVRDFDVPRTARFVLGRYWKDTPEQQREEFRRTFEHYMVHIYAGQFNRYHDVVFDVISAQPVDPNRTSVRTVITRRDMRPPVHVDWQVVRSADTYKIIDVSVEGVSQILTLRHEFLEVMDHNGGSVSGLIASLREKTDE
jgi:phospholipid transport system substrate-binding protein